jgi:hypothetical protein
MRHLPRTACAYLVGCFIAAASVPAFADDIGFTIDLLAPSTNCVGSVCPSDISLPQLGGVAGATTVSMLGTSSTVTLDNVVAQPIVCSEVKNSSPPYGFGPTGAYEISPVFSNAFPGGLFEFDSGGASIVDATSVSNDGTVFSIHQPNQTTTQVACYSISPLGVTNPQYTTGSVTGDRVFYSRFEGGHVSGEPWVSINTVASPTSAQDNTLGYVMQIHNASSAVNWYLSLGYDQEFFNPPGGFVPQWCVLDTVNSPQPGPVKTVPLCGPVTSIRTLVASDIQSATNSIYIFVQDFGGTTAVSNWVSMPSTFYPASGAVFSPPGVYAQRIDDKVAVAGASNVPVQNVGNIVCANDPAATSCTVFDQDGNLLPASVTFANQVSTGAVTIDPVAYVVDPVAPLSGPTTLPGTVTTLTAPTNVSCVDPNGIFASAVSASNFATSTGALGARAFNFNFKPSGALFVPGTATCTATFASNGLSSTQSFTVTMQELTVTHFEVTADTTAVAGNQVNFTVTAKDGANNTVPSYAGTVIFSSSSDPQAVLPANSQLINGVGSFAGTFKTAGSQTFTATDTVSSTIHGTSNNVTVSAAAANSFSVVMLGNATVGVATGVNVTALDQFNNEATSYTGTVVFASTDGIALLPVPGPLNHGSHGSASVTFFTAGTQTVTVTDGSITGTSNPVVVDTP